MDIAKIVEEIRESWMGDVRPNVSSPLGESKVRDLYSKLYDLAPKIETYSLIYCLHYSRIIMDTIIEGRTPPQGVLNLFDQNISQLYLSTRPRNAVS